MLAKAIEELDCDWAELWQHLYAGHIPGFIWTDQGHLVCMPTSDWGSPKNNEAAVSGRATRLNPAIVGGRDLKGFALVKASDLETFKPTNQQRTTTGAETACKKWMSELVQTKTKTKAKIPKRDELKKEAMNLFPGLSGRGFIRVWDEVAPQSGRGAVGNRDVKSIHQLNRDA